ncbi:hypothetical protein ACSAGD_05910 [Paramicrobacterium sp. CJ85]|uniref:hypothetical protein n=1 Tax=Paramicrobacterium sp. CJ85 TaxID=3445355 RepID=UPI003F5D7C6B
MSTAVARATRPLESPQRRPETRPLRAVPLREKRRTRPKLAYALTTITAVSGIVVAQLLSSVALSQGAYELSALKSQQRALSLEQQSLNQQLEVLRSPQNVAQSAQELGMVINQSPVYLKLSTGTVLGVPGPGGEATERPLGDSFVENSLIVPQTPGADESKKAGEPEKKAPSSPLPFDGGLPSPKTH